MRSINEQDLSELDAGLAAVADGDLTRTAQAHTTEVPMRGRDEVAELSRTFNETLAKVQRSIAGYDGMRLELSRIVSEVSRSAGSVSDASQAMASTSEEAGKAVGEIASAVGDVAQGAEL